MMRGKKRPGGAGDGGRGRPGPGKRCSQRVQGASEWTLFTTPLSMLDRMMHYLSAPGRTRLGTCDQATVADREARKWKDKKKKKKKRRRRGNARTAQRKLSHSSSLLFPPGTSPARSPPPPHSASPLTPRFGWGRPSPRPTGWAGAGEARKGPRGSGQIGQRGRREKNSVKRRAMKRGRAGPHQAAS